MGPPRMTIVHGLGHAEEFIERLRSASESEVESTVIRLNNSAAVEQALGWPFFLLDETVPVAMLAPDSHLSTLVWGVATHLRKHLDTLLTSALSVRQACAVSRSLAREVTRLLSDDIMPLIVRGCPDCEGDVCITSGVAVCALCMRFDTDGPLPRLVLDADGICPIIEEMVHLAVADSAVVALYEAECAESETPVMIVDMITYDDETAVGAQGFLRLQAFLRLA